MPKPRNVHRFTLRSRAGTPEGAILTGARAELLIDGKPLKGVTKLRLEIDACDVARIHLTLVGGFDTHILGELYPVKRNIRPRPKRKNLKPNEDY